VPLLETWMGIAVCGECETPVIFEPGEKSHWTCVTQNCSNSSGKHDLQELSFTFEQSGSTSYVERSIFHVELIEGG